MTERRALAVRVIWVAIVSMAAAGSLSANLAFSQENLTCAVFLTYGHAQAYYALHPEAQLVLDPDQDGAACETWFGVEAPDYLPGGPPPAITRGAALADEDC